LAAGSISGHAPQADGEGVKNWPVTAAKTLRDGYNAVVIV